MYNKITGRNIAQFLIDNNEVLVMIRNGKIRIEANCPVQLEMVASNTFNLIPSDDFFIGVSDG